VDIDDLLDSLEQAGDEMGGIFAKQKKSRVTDQDKAVLQLKNQRDQIKQYQKKIQIKLEKERELAKQLIKQNKKDRALLLLKKKKFQEGLLEKTDNQLLNLEKLTHDIEFAQVEAKVLDGLKAGNVALKQLNEMYSVEDVEKIMDETAEAVEKQQEIDALLSGGLSSEDMEDVEAELDEIIKSQLPAPVVEEELPAEEEEVQLPEVPMEEPQPAKTKSERREKEAVMVPA